MNAKLILVGLMSLVAVGMPQAAAGQDWFYGCPYYTGYGGFGWQPSYYASESLPYFSLHPPVYYSYRVPRTYGYSPFAYPPGVLTPGSEPPRAAHGQNMYQNTPEGTEATGSQQGRPPLRIDNPFVEQSGKQGVTRDRRPAGRQPQVVYPAALAQRTS
jgi:hypothetical protein